MKIIQMHNSTICQMMGYLLITEHGKVIAVDGGTEGDKEEFEHLVRQNGGHIDLWLLTHPHSDHVGTFWSMTEHSSDILADCVCYSPAADDFTANEDCYRNDIERFRKAVDSTYYPMHIAKVHERFYIDNLTVEILRIVNPCIKEDCVNNLSMVFRVTEQISQDAKFTMMFLGDLGERGGEELLDLYAADQSVLRADAVQMAHHGQCGVGLPVYRAIAPRWSFWPTPDWLWTNTPRGSTSASGPWKTLEVRAWMEDLGAEPVTCLEEHAVFESTENV